MKIRLASELQIDSVVDGTGIRTVIWTQGCGHHCPGCHNPNTHDFDGGFEKDVEELIEEIHELEAQTGITFSGGDPFYQPEACAIIAKSAHKCQLDVWCYTGFTFEELMAMSKKNTIILDFLRQIDILVDGRFIMEKHSYNLKFRGSSNQRIIDVKASLQNNRVIISKIDDIEEDSNHGRYDKKGLYV